MTSGTRKKFSALAVRLDEERARSEEDLALIDRDVELLAYDEDQEGGVPSNHMADEGSDVYERERLLTIRGEIAARLEQILAAQQRMEDGTYGICQNCGKPIPEERLQALPFATLCIDCQEAAES